MEATQARMGLYHAPESRASITRTPSIQIPIKRSLAKKLLSAGHRKSLRFESALDVQRKRGGAVSREETTLLPIREPYPRPPMTLLRRFRSWTGTSVLAKKQVAYAAVPGAGATAPYTCGICPVYCAELIGRRAMHGLLSRRRGVLGQPGSRVPPRKGDRRNRPAAAASAAQGEMRPDR